jgi:hypothetical protein
VDLTDHSSREERIDPLGHNVSARESNSLTCTLIELIIIYVILEGGKENFATCLRKSAKALI